MPTEAGNKSARMITMGAGAVREAVMHTRAALTKMQLKNLIKNSQFSFV
jgi:hypothetical protein